MQLTNDQSRAPRLARYLLPAGAQSTVNCTSRDLPHGRFEAKLRSIRFIRFDL